MKTQKFIVSGRMKKGESRKFSLEVDASTEKHASALARAKLAGKHRLRSTLLEITEVKKK